MIWGKTLSMICLAGYLTACSSVNLSDVATGAGAVAGATLGAVTGNPAVVAVTTTGGAAVGAVLVGDEPSDADVLNAIPEEQRAEVAKSQALWHAIEEFIHWIVGAVVALIALAWVLPGPQRLFRKPKNPKI